MVVSNQKHFINQPTARYALQAAAAPRLESNSVLAISSKNKYLVWVSNTAFDGLSKNR